MGLKVRRQIGLPVVYDGIDLEVGYKLDLLVEDQVVVESKPRREFFQFTRHSCYPIYGLAVDQLAC